MSTRVSIIGAGKLGATHLRHWLRIADVAVVSLLDTRKETAEALARSADPSPGVFDDFATLLARSRPDVVDICTPTSTHRDYIEQAAAAGRAVFV